MRENLLQICHKVSAHYCDSLSLLLFLPLAQALCADSNVLPSITGVE